jgi:hypothetical protein
MTEKELNEHFVDFMRAQYGNLTKDCLAQALKEGISPEQAIVTAFHEASLLTMSILASIVRDASSNEAANEAIFLGMSRMQKDLNYMLEIVEENPDIIIDRSLLPGYMSRS